MEDALESMQESRGESGVVGFFCCGLSFVGEPRGEPVQRCRLQLDALCNSGSYNVQHIFRVRGIFFGK